MYQQIEFALQNHMPNLPFYSKMLESPILISFFLFSILIEMVDFHIISLKQDYKIFYLSKQFGRENQGLSQNTIQCGQHSKKTYLSFGLHHYNAGNKT